MSFVEPNPHVPPLVADAFVHRMLDRNIVLSFDRAALESQFDLVLDLEDFRDRDTGSIRIDSVDAAFDMESAASAFLGETLARLYDGKWTGHFSNQASVNFYSSTLTFGSFELSPIRWLSYRVANGRDEGSVADWLRRVLPSIEARQDLTRQAGIGNDSV